MISDMTVRQKIAILGASFLQRDLIQCANSMGLETHVFAWQEGNVVRDLADFCYDISLRDAQSILELCKAKEIDAIVTSSSDVGVPTMALVAQELKLVGPTIACAEAATHKGEMRKLLAAGGCSTPRFYVASSMPEKTIFPYPFVVKASDRSGSRGVRIVRNAAEFKEAFSEAKKVSFSGDVVVEEMMNGRQFSLEMASVKGRHYLVAVTEEFLDKEALCEKGDLVPARLTAQEVDCLFKECTKGLDAINFSNGISHTELFWDGERARIIEVGIRIGGDFRNRLVKEATGINLDRVAIEIALNRNPSESLKPKKSGSALISWAFDENDEGALEANGYTKVNLKRTRPSSSNERLGFSILTAESDIAIEMKRNQWD